MEPAAALGTPVVRVPEAPYQTVAPGAHCWPPGCAFHGHLQRGSGTRIRHVYLAFGFSKFALVEPMSTGSNLGCSSVAVSKVGKGGGAETV